MRYIHQRPENSGSSSALGAHSTVESPADHAQAQVTLGVEVMAPCVAAVFMGSEKTKRTLDDAATVVAAAQAAISPISDLRCSKEYREHMVGVFIRRLLREVA